MVLFDMLKFSITFDGDEYKIVEATDSLRAFQEWYKATGWGEGKEYTDSYKIKRNGPNEWVYLISVTGPQAYDGTGKPKPLTKHKFKIYVTDITNINVTNLDGTV